MDVFDYTYKSTIKKIEELGNIYESHGFKGKALKVYEKLYETNKSDEIKEKIEQLKMSDKGDILDLEGGEEPTTEGESVFSELDKKAPIELEDKEKGTGEKKGDKEGEEEVDDSFREWIDGLCGASSG